MEILLNILHSPMFRRFVIAPFAVIGFYQIFRGVIAIVEKDLSEKDWMRGWMVVAYVVITLLGCTCLIAAI